MRILLIVPGTPHYQSYESMNNGIYINNRYNINPTDPIYNKGIGNVYVSDPSYKKVEVCPI